MSESWDDFAEEWDLNPEVILYAENAFKSLIEEIDISFLNILDFGCGTGILTEKMSHSAGNVVAIDNSAKMIDVLSAKNIKNTTSLAIDIFTADLKSAAGFDRKFDLITASSVFNFVDDYGTALTILKNHLAPNGRLIQWDWYSNGTSTGFTPEMIEAAYANAGFSVLKIKKAFELTGERGTMPVIMAIASPQY